MQDILNRRSLAIMLLGVAMNYGLFALCQKWELPLWLDLTGTAYAAYLLGPVPGLLVGLVNNLILALFYFGVSTTPYYLISATVAVLVGFYGQRGAVRDFLSFAGLVVVIYWLSVFLSVALSLLIYRNGYSGDYWGEVIYCALEPELGRVWAVTLATLLVKLSDVLVGALVVLLAISLTPKAWRKK